MTEEFIMHGQDFEPTISSPIKPVNMQQNTLDKAYKLLEEAEKLLGDDNDEVCECAYDINSACEQLTWTITHLNKIINSTK